MGKKAQAALQQGQTGQRLNFLYQAATMMAHAAPDAQPTHGLARYYITTMRKISRRQVLRMDPNLKRTWCKRCDTPLIPGITSSVKIVSGSEKRTVTRCRKCGARKSWLAQPNHTLLTERLQAPEEE